MSVVVAVKKGNQVAMGSDSMTHFGSTCYPVDNHKATKIFEIGDSYLAVTGWSMYYDIITDFIKRKKQISLLTMAEISQAFRELWKELHSKYSFVNDQCGNNVDSPFAHLDAAFLIMNKSGVFHVASDMSVNFFEKYNAIGSGSKLALGAVYALYDSNMDAESIVNKAVQSAIGLNIYCGGKITIKKMNLE